MDNVDENNTASEDSGSAKAPVLITGASGFSGYAMHRFLDKIGRPWAGVDTNPHADHPRAIRQGDICSRYNLTEILREVQPDSIVHLAAITERSNINIDRLMAVNYLGTVNLLETIAAETPRARILVVGSSAQYGAVQQEECPVQESQPLRPVSHYGISKAAQYLAALRAWRVEGVQAMCSVTFNLIGPGLPDELAPGQFARQIAEAELGIRPPQIITHGLDDFRDYVDIRDATRAYWLLLERGLPGQTYNVCSGQAVPLNAILEMMRKRAYCKIEVRVETQPTEFSVPYQCGSNALITVQTGWRPVIDLEQSIDDLLNYWRERTSKQRESKV